jgi:hypothetical protein
MPTSKWLFLKNLRSKTLGQIQNLDPHRLMSRLKSKTTPGEHSSNSHINIRAIGRERLTPSAVTGTNKMAAGDNSSDSAVVSVVQANTRPRITAMIAVIASPGPSRSRTGRGLGRSASPPQRGSFFSGTIYDRSVGRPPSLPIV